MRTNHVLRYAVLVALAVFSGTFTAVAQSGEGRRLVVSAGGDYHTIEAALQDAANGDVIEVYGGVYETPLIVDKSVSLVGIDSPVIDGGGEGSLVIITAPDVLFQGFTLRNTGHSLNREDTGIVAQAPRVTIAENMLENVLFGIYFAQASDGVARDNIIHGIDLGESLRGDSIRVWYSDRVQLIGNEVTTSRDVLIWYANDSLIQDNRLYENRYGLHFMYSSRANLVRNTIQDNTVGVYLMYSNGLRMHENIVTDNRGPSGYGLALKDMDDVIVEKNWFVGNSTGIYIDNSPALYEGYNLYTENLIAYNDIGISALPSVHHNLFQRNIFLENMEQSAVQGRGTLQGNVWHQDGIGNYWSDYVGYDADSDGVGELPYKSEKLFESLIDAYPALRLFAYSPATQALDFAAAAFPSLRPEPKLIDDAPLTQYLLPLQMTDDGSHTLSIGLLSAALLLVGMGGSLCVFAVWFALPRQRR